MKLHTIWDISGGLKYDLACFLNLVKGDRFHVEHHPDVYEHFKASFDCDLVEKLRSSPFTHPSTAAKDWMSLIDCNDDSITKIVANLQDYVDNNHDSSRLDDFWREWIKFFNQVYLHLDSIGFQQYWLENCKPRLLTAIEQARETLSKYDIWTLIRKMVGRRDLPHERRIRVVLSCFAAPIGMQLPLEHGVLTDIRYDVSILVENSLHEILHQYFDRNKSSYLIEGLRKDEYFTHVHQTLGRKWGYQRFDSFVDENVTEAVHIYLSQQLGIRKDPHRYFQVHDEGSHVLSPLIFEALKHGYREQVATFDDFLKLIWEQGFIKPGTIKERLTALGYRVL